MRVGAQRGDIGATRNQPWLDPHLFVRDGTGERSRTRLRVRDASDVLMVWEFWGPRGVTDL